MPVESRSDRDLRRPSVFSTEHRSGRCDQDVTSSVDCKTVTVKTPPNRKRHDARYPGTLRPPQSFSCLSRRTQEAENMQEENTQRKPYITPINVRV